VVNDSEHILIPNWPESAAQTPVAAHRVLSLAAVGAAGAVELSEPDAFGLPFVDRFAPVVVVLTLACAAVL
jgi:hypothetical protein